MTSSQLVTRTVDRIPVIKEAEVPKIYTKTKEEVGLDKEYYHGVYLFLEFNKKYDADKKEKYTGMKANPNKEYMCENTWDSTQDTGRKCCMTSLLTQHLDEKLSSTDIVGKGKKSLIQNYLQHISS